MVSLYDATFAVSLLMIAVYFFVDKKHDKWLLLLFTSVAVCDMGYLLLSVSKTLEGALWANSVAYLGSVFLPFFLLMMIMKLSQIKVPKYLPWVLIGINTVMLFIATSGGYLPIYYKNVSLDLVDGVAVLVKEYGPLHNVYKIYLFAYFAAMVSIIIYTMVKKTAASIKHSVFLAFVVIGNIAIWLVENIIHSGFEFLAISYIITEGLILLLYGILQDYEKNNEKSSVAEIEIKVVENEEAVCDNLLKDLSEREKEVLPYLLDNTKRKEIAEKLFVTESTIKKHTSSIYKKLEVTSRAELLEKLKHR
ncbi:MAG: hypothetical protein IKL16_03325 [Clostridia bacterium]|nr:hypothetical protein [Clostridia bacterium]